MAAAPVISSRTRDQLSRAHRAASAVARLDTEAKNSILLTMARDLEWNQDRILAANAQDLSADLTVAVRDRLLLNPERIGSMVEGIRAVAALDDPVGKVIAQWTRPNGLRIRQIRVPLGVLGVVYEARPNVTADAIALALKAGNTVVLRGGRDATRTNQVLVAILSQVAGLPEGSIELLDSESRDSVIELIRARGLVDLVVPRGGPGLISFVVENSTVPVIETGAGNCHIFVDESADFTMADGIVINAKTQRPSVCNAAEKLLVHDKVAAEYLPRIIALLLREGVQVRADARTRDVVRDSRILTVGTEDWGTEYLDLCIAVKVVNSLEQAIEHINRYSTRHSEAIITASEENAREFLSRVDSAAVYWNASTRFTDGGEFGFGAELGISTQKLHCRGPFALPELTSIKYEIFGSGQVRA